MQLAFRRDWISAWVTPFVGIGCGVAIALLQFPQLQQLQTQSQTASVEQLQRAVATESARLALLRQMPSFGYDNLLSDFVFLNFLQYFGDHEARQKTDYRLSPEYFEIIVDRDPYFTRAYWFISTSTAMYAGMPERSTAMMQRGLQALKPNIPADSFYAWRYLAIDQLIFLGDPQAARQSYLTAAQWAGLSNLPDAPDVAAVSHKTADFLTRNPNSRMAQLSAWVTVLSLAPDPKTQAIAIGRIEALGGKLSPQPDGSYRVRLPSKD